MMHISPCGWYCFKIDIAEELWRIEDTDEKTLIIPHAENCVIELLSARKSSSTSADEISDLHEAYISEEKLIPTKTVLSDNSCGIKFFVTRGNGPDENIWIICHAFWSNYCVFMRFHGSQHDNSNSQIQFFYDVLASLQPLTTD